MHPNDLRQYEHRQNDWRQNKRVLKRSASKWRAPKWTAPVGRYEERVPKRLRLRGNWPHTHKRHSGNYYHKIFYTHYTSLLVKFKPNSRSCNKKYNLSINWAMNTVNLFETYCFGTVCVCVLISLVTYSIFQSYCSLILDI